MKSELVQPQEIEVYYLLPAIRSYFAHTLKEQGMSQKDIAAKLHIQTSTVSQYLHEKRGKQITFPDEIVKEIKASAGKLNDKMDLVRETQHILALLRKTKVLCQVHKQFGNVPDQCNIETMKCA